MGVFFFPHFFGGRLGVFLGSGHPQSSRMYNRKLANHSRTGVPHDNAASLGWPTGLASACELEAMALGEGYVEKCWLRTFFFVHVGRVRCHKASVRWK